MRGVWPCLALIVAAWASPASAYPEFEVWVEKTSGRYIDCAMCHTHPDGPEGVKAGQIRSLSPEELDRLNDARSAFEPGMGVDSPILNAFGDQIIDRIGKTRFLEIRSSDPGQLIEEYGEDSDIDGDGIPDVREYAGGTLPTDPHHGDPWALFRINLARQWFGVLMTILATIAGLYGLNHFLRLVEHSSEPRERLARKETDTTLGYLARHAAARTSRRSGR